MSILLLIQSLDVGEAWEGQEGALYDLSYHYKTLASLLHRTN
jgi:hypothetical protein